MIIIFQITEQKRKFLANDIEVQLPTRVMSNFIIMDPSKLEVRSMITTLIRK